MAAKRIIVGSKNPAKVGAVAEFVLEFPALADAEVLSMEVPSGIPDQPRTLEEITTGAVNRARAAYGDCDFSFGIEAGFMEVPNTKSGYMNMCAVAIHDGQQTHLGLSSGFETPNPEIMRLVAEEGMTLNEAAQASGFTTDPEIGRADGVIGTLTHGKVDRKEYVTQALRTAFIHIDT